MLGKALIRFRRFAGQPWDIKARAIRGRVKRLLNSLVPGVPVPTLIAPGLLWLAWDDVCGDEVFSGAFENAERQFVSTFIRPGMTIVDVGAHHGLYTLIAARRAGRSGRVISFEPSPRERRRLKLHVLINGLWNVSIEPSALGASTGEQDLYLVQGRDTGCNSLRTPSVSGPTVRLRVPVRRLDDVLAERRVGRVDFVKIDAEGAELDILRGSANVLQESRPVILCEVQDARTRPWGYRAAEIIRLLTAHGYSWWVPERDGSLAPFAPGENPRSDICGTFVAAPEVAGLLRRATGGKRGT